MTESADAEFLRSIFLMEAWESLGTLEEGMARLAAGATPAPDDPLFLVSHRLRGAASLHGFAAVADLAQMLERLVNTMATAPPAVRAAGAREGARLLGDLKARLDAIEAGGPPETAPASAGLPVGDDPVRAELDRFFAANADILSYFGPEASEHLDAMTTALVALDRDGGLEADLAELFRATHTLKGAAYVVGCTRVGHLAHRLEDVLVAAREHRTTVSRRHVETAYAVVDAIKCMLGLAPDPSVNLTALAQALGARLAALLEDAGGEPTPPASTPPAVTAGPAVAAAARVATPAPAASTPAGPRPAARPGSSARQTIRVGLDRLDAVMNLVGELVIARSTLERRLLDLDRVNDVLFGSRARMVQAVGDFERKHHDPRLPAPRVGAEPAPAGEPAGLGHQSVAELFAELEFDRYDDFNIFARSIAEISSDVSEIQAQLVAVTRVVREDLAHVHRLTGALRNEIGRARLVPIGQLFARFVRQAQEAARAAGKTVRIETSGEAVELDTGIIEQIVDPVLHLVQNAVVHGLENADERRALGKPVAGTLELTATHHGGFVYVDVADDGRGIDVDVIRRRAVAQGFVRPDAAAAMSDKEALDLIFLPGFSTSTAVTTTAGRGVGMDVVRTNVARLNGEVQVRTEPGEGTRFTLRLPLTVLVTEALLVHVGAETLAVPLNALHSIVTLRPEDVRLTAHGEMVTVEERSIALIHLDEILALPAGVRGASQPALVLRGGGEPFAVQVDEVLHREEIVIKSLGHFLDGVGPYAGATISADGRVTLVLDPIRLGEIAAAHAAVGRAELPSEEDLAPVLAAPSAGRRVLLVDDSISVRKFVGQMLDKAGFAVITANDGADALRQLGEATFDVVITDLEMPRVNGYELIEDIRRRPATRALPVVVLTTRSGDKHVSLARRLGVSHYVTKPVDEQRFVALIESIVGVVTAP